MTAEWVLAHLQRLLRPHVGWYGLFAALLLTALGICAIGTVQPDLAMAQATRWLPIALVMMVVCLLPRPRELGMATYPLMAVSIALLLFLLLPFVPRAIVPVRNGATSWISVGPMNFQPSELAKIVFVLALARYMRYRDSYRTLRGLLVPFVIMFVPVGLILKEPDLGTALIFPPTLFAVLVAAGAKLRHLGTLLAIGLLAVGINVAIVAFHAPKWMHPLEPHQEVRIAAMLWPDRYKSTEGYQQAMSKRLIAAGGLTGYGEDRARTMLRFNHLPYDYNDMIFAVVVARWGLLGGAAVLGLYSVLTGSFLLAAARSRDPFVRLSCVGLGVMIFTQAAVNLGVTIGVVPCTGITLPLMSYGGSSLVSTFMMVGLMFNFASRRPAALSRPSFEFDEVEVVLETR